MYSKNLNRLGAVSLSLSVLAIVVALAAAGLLLTACAAGTPGAGAGSMTGNIDTGGDANDDDNTGDGSGDNGNDNDGAGTGDNDNSGEEENQPPEADAGSDQSVDGGASVDLDGSGSSDADGDSLSFLWTQIGGTPVNLSSPEVEMPSFTAPNESITLTFDLTVNDGNGGSDTDLVTVLVTSIVTPQLYIANSGATNNIISYQTPSTVNGNIAPDTNLQGATTNLDSPADLVIDGINRLIAVNQAGASITTYADAPGTNGNVDPDGTVQGAATLLVSPVSLALNASNELMVADVANNALYTFENPAQSTFNGNLPPSRTLTSANLNLPTGINFDSQGHLYVANNGSNEVLVYANAAELNGNFAATRIITSSAFISVFDVFVDEDDRLYVVDPVGFIHSFTEATTLNGEENPDFSLQVPPAANLTAITVDSNGTGYIVDGPNRAIYVYDGITTRNGPSSPDRTIFGDQTQLNSPVGIFLVE